MPRSETSGSAPPTAPPSSSPGKHDSERRRLDAYAIAAILIFVAIVVCCWENFVGVHEELYLLGSRRIADPTFLAADFTWSRLSPTRALFDHLVAPLWRLFDGFAIANIGRFVYWSLMAWAIVRLARAARLPAWSAVAGLTLWLLWDQTLGMCGSPFEGFQPKSLAYPLVFLSLAHLVRGETARAGLTAGLATAFHVIIGGWALMAVTLTALIQRGLFTPRQVGVMLLAAAPFVVPLALVMIGEGAHVTRADRATMNGIYARFAMPHCCDVFYFFSSRKVPLGWARAGVVFALAPIALFRWPERRAARIIGTFTVALIAFFLAGVVARALSFDGLLELYPFQLANALPALFLFLFAPAWLVARGASGAIGIAARFIVLVGTLWLVIDRGVPRALWERPQTFAANVSTAMTVPGDVEDPVFAWIRDHTPRDAVFITPFITEFWPYAQRAQVASMREPPLDRRLIEWRQRLEAMNGFQPFTRRGWDTADELERHERALTIPDLIRIRDRYRATHYMTHGERGDLAAHLIHAESGFCIYELGGLAPLTSRP
jgi:hypothetical protein